MELFLPSVLVFLFAIILTFYISPKLTPMIVAVLSAVFLSYGVYDHYKQFESEYRLSTWQEIFKVYAPAIMILAVILFVIYGILAFFTGGQVPIPALPNLNQVESSLSNSFNNVSTSFSSATNSMVNAANNSFSNASSMFSASNNMNTNANANNNNTNKNKNKNNTPSRSLYETL
jgi:predicted PurR-regulated permease PerM